MEKSVKLLEKISGNKPIHTATKKRIPTWGVRPGLEIGVKVTIRGEKASIVLQKLFGGVENTIKISKFDDMGNFSFGIPEYINMPDIEYDHDIGIMGLEVAVTLKRPGYRIRRRTIKKKSIPLSHQIKKEEAIEFIKNKFKVEVN